MLPLVATLGRHRIRQTGVQNMIPNSSSISSCSCPGSISVYAWLLAHDHTDHSLCSPMLHLPFFSCQRCLCRREVGYQTHMEHIQTQIHIKNIIPLLVPSFKYFCKAFKEVQKWNIQVKSRVINKGLKIPGFIQVLPYVLVIFSILNLWHKDSIVSIFRQKRTAKISDILCFSIIP